MKSGSELHHRRQVLIAQIDSQRMELAQAYRQLEKPIHYGEMALQGFGFLRKNPWVAMALPGVTGLLFSGIGALFRRGKPKAERIAVDRDELRRVLREEETKVKKPLHKYAGYAWKAFQLYRRFRPLFL